MGSRETMKSFAQDNAEYETWLRTQCHVVEKDLRYKHQRMTLDAFTFLRATCFRWSKCIEVICPELEGTPPVLSVGDAHLENFGTWRDDEGRLVWGINDFDEAADIPYAYDLLRLAVSARLARNVRDKKDNLKPFLLLSNQETANALLKGYRKGLENPHATIVDEEENAWLRPYVICKDGQRKKFWKEFEGYKSERIPDEIMAGFEKRLPERAVITMTAPRLGQGGGSLGRPRFVAVADWRGGCVVREAKALVLAAWDSAHQRQNRPRFEDVATGEYRSCDPWLKVTGGFIFRRLAADARKVNLTNRTDLDSPEGDAGEVCKLLEAMGFDLAAIHMATHAQVKAIKDDFDKREDGWLNAAARKAAKWVNADYEEWRKAQCLI
jgi:hypothetical protein